MNYGFVEITEALALMTQVTSINHVFDDCLAERGGGQVRYVLELGVRLYLVWSDNDTSEMVVSPFSLWDTDNLLDVVDDVMPVMSFKKIDRDAFG